MALDLDAVHTGITAAFDANTPAVAALLGGLREAEGKQNSLSPYAVFQYITGAPDPTFTSDGEVLNYQFSVFNQDKDKSRDFTILNDAVKKLTAVFDDATLTLTAHTSIGVTRGTSGFLPTVDQTQGFFINYEIMIEDD